MHAKLLLCVPFLVLNMSSLYLSKPAEREFALSYQETGSITFQETDNDDVVLSPAGKVYTMEFYTGNHDLFKTITATNDNTAKTFTFEIADSFWTGFDLKKGYNYRVMREHDDENIPLLTGEVNVS